MARRVKKSTLIKSAKSDLKTEQRSLRQAYKDLQKQINQERRSYRKQIAILKRHGLAYNTVDISKIEPTKYGRSILNKLKGTGIFEGNARVQKVSKDEARILSEQSKHIFHTHAILPKTEESNQRLVKRKGMKVREIQEYADGELRYIPLVAFENWDDFLDDMREKWDDFQANGHQLAFRYYGHLSRDTFGSIDKLLNKLQGYKGALGVEINSLSANDMNDVIQHIEIYKTNIKDWREENKKRETRIKNRRKRARPYNARIERIRSTGGEDAVYAFRVGEAAARKKRRKRK